MTSVKRPTRTHRRKPTWNGEYVCEWGCGKRYVRGADYAAHGAKHFWAGDKPKG